MSKEATLDDFEDVEARESRFGPLPQDWQAVALDNVTLFSTTSSGLEPFSGSRTYVPTGGVEGGKIVDDDGQITYDDRPSRANLEVETGDVLFAKMEDSVKVLRATEDITDNVYSTGFIRVSSNPDVNSEYLKQLLLSDRFNKTKDSIAIGSTQPAINLSDLTGLIVPIAPLQEQRKIATVLYTVDRAIEETKKVGEQVKRVKKALAQKLIHKGIGSSDTKNAWMGEIPSHWDVQEFSEIVEFSQNGIYKDKDEYGGPHPIIKMGDIFGGVKLNAPIREQVHLDDEEIDKYGTAEGDLVFARHAQAGWGAGDCTYIHEIEENAVVESNMVQVRLNNDVDPLFYAQYFNSEIGVKSIKRITTTGNIKSISQEDLMNLKVPVPPEGEQEEIAEILSVSDEQANHSESEVERLRRLKKGLMQDLLSGTLRTTNTNIEVPEEIA